MVILSKRGKREPLKTRENLSEINFTQHGVSSQDLKEGRFEREKNYRKVRIARKMVNTTDPISNDMMQS